MGDPVTTAEVWRRLLELAPYAGGAATTLVAVVLWLARHAYQEGVRRAEVRAQIEALNLAVARLSEMEGTVTDALQQIAVLSSRADRDSRRRIQRICTPLPPPPDPDPGRYAHHREPHE